jgi:hypothetical protein
MVHEPLQLLQWTGWPNVPVNCHSWDSLLHWVVAWQTMSSDPHLEHTGVDLADRWSVSDLGPFAIRLNGLTSVLRCIFRPAILFG